MFAQYFNTPNLIIERIESLYEIRKRVAHNSSDLTKDELLSVKAYSKEIIKQIDPYI